MRTEIPVQILTVAGGNLQAVAGATVQINVRGGGAATVYAGETGGTTLANPLASDAFGRVAGWVERGRYAALVSGGGLTPYEEDFESVPGADGAVDSAWLAAAAVLAANIAPGAVGNSHLALAAVAKANLQANVLPRFVNDAAFGALTPADGDEVYYIADAANAIIWHMRYNAGSASAYKWESVNDPASLTAEGSVALTVVTSTNTAVTSLRVTAVRAGEYNITAEWQGSAAGALCAGGWCVNGTTYTIAPGGGQYFRRRQTLPAGATIDFAYNGNTGGTGLAIRIQPVRFA